MISYRLIISGDVTTVLIFRTTPKKVFLGTATRINNKSNLVTKNMIVPSIDCFVNLPILFISFLSLSKLLKKEKKTIFVKKKPKKNYA